MSARLSWKNFKKVTTECKIDPAGVLPTVNNNDLRLIAFEAAQDVYHELMERLEGNKELQELVRSYDLLMMVHHWPNSIDASFIEDSKKTITDIWPRLAAI